MLSAWPLVHAKWVNRGEGQSNFDQNATLQGRIHHFLGALQPAPGRSQAFLSVYIHGTDFDVQSELRSQNFAGVDRALDNAPTDRYKVFIHADKRLTNEHIRLYHEPSCSEFAALIPGKEDRLIGKRDISVRERAQSNANGNEILDRVSITLKS